VFHPFHTTKPTGTGLGLTIARRIAVDHGGELRVESAPGRTVFTLSLPARR
jgi:nitrogen-specific signal transduction histidine kinase